MKNLKLQCIMFLFACLMLEFSLAAQGLQQLPAPDRNIQGDTEPYQVILYKQANFVNPIGSWRLTPGMRLLKVSQINQMPNSVLLGAKVSLFLLAPDFSAKFSRTIDFSTPNLATGSSFSGCSIVIYRKDFPDFLGVYLSEGGYTKYSGRFFFMPETARDLAVIYPKIPHIGQNLEVAYLVGGANKGELLKKTAAYPKPISVKLTDIYGQTYDLPTDGNIYWGRLDTISNQDDISSIKMEYHGAITPEAYDEVPHTRVVAPTAPDPFKPLTYPAQVISPSRNPLKMLTYPAKVISTSPPPNPVPDISGQWNSTVGYIYNITQTSDRFSWFVANINQKGQGVLIGNDIFASWSGPQGSSSTQGKITATDSKGKATKIEWQNGVRFYR